ncbi:MAG: anaerobic carbon-monoxide dehydrogenase catalytic subunit [Bacteroidetes bacterium]|nr:anaerobic carbon-monoxide dehydrogenase catalytic subunit [Bacteroidota bacterium]MCL5025174.1 anaerobic carbon-monoxide dehydrogenase catalytic subunit [Chloroflexota bacterium]
MATGEKEKTIDPAAQAMLDISTAEGISTAFSRAEAMRPCPIGRGAGCCSVCFAGPCRLATRPGSELTGVCGATQDTIAARYFARAVAAGAAAHSDHGRDMALTLLATATGKAPGYGIHDERKLRKVAHLMNIKIDGRSKEEIAIDVANAALAQFGNQNGEIIYLSRAPQKRQEVWRQQGIATRGIDREIVETMHRTGMGTDQDPEHILTHAMRTSLGDGWGGSMLGTDIGDILFGTPSPLRTKVNLGVLKEDEVNILVHGHEPTLSEMIVAAACQPDVIEYAKSKGAKGINIAGLCCTANEVLMRQGIPSAGNFLQQELAMVTGAVEAMIVDVQCIMEALSPLTERFHTKLITTSPKAKIPGAMHIQFDEHDAMAIAKLIVRTAIDNYPNRPKTRIPEYSEDLVAGFSHEYISYMLGGIYRDSFRPLNDAIVQGRIRGVVAVVGCNNPRETQDYNHHTVVKELLGNDVLIVQTGCGAIANAKYGLLTPEAMEYAGPGLREVCEAVGMPPVLHVGSCVDNSRILTALSHMVAEGGLGDDISDLPVAGIAPEWMHEKALSIATYAVASGVYVIMGGDNPIGHSESVTRLVSAGWEKQVGGKLEFEREATRIVEKTLAHIAVKRAALKLVPKYEPGAYSRTFVSKLAQLSRAAGEEEKEEETAQSN